MSQLNQQEQELRECAEMYRDLCENANDLIQCVTPDGRILYVNRAWKETLGYSDEEVAGLTLLDIIHPESQAHCMAVFKSVIAGERVDKIEAVLVAKDGKEIVVEGSANCRFEGGKPISTRSIFRDITERKKMEEALIQSEILKSIGIITAGIAHEFNNILAIISGNVQLLEKKYKDHTELSNALLSIKKATDDGIEISSKMLNVTRTEVDITEYVITDILAGPY